MTRKPAILTGKPIFKATLPIMKPPLPGVESLKEELNDILSSGIITNDKYVRMFEHRCAEYLKVKHCVAVSNCTSALLLTLRCLSLKDEVILPSFTFTATAHALLWNGLKPVFVDIQEDTFNIDCEAIEEKITDKTSCIIAVHMFGNPCDTEKLEDICKRHNLKLIFDSAHAFGSRRAGKPVGSFGDAECFSLSPTKLITSGEGGLITTSDAKLADKLKLARNYGVEADYDSLILGLNARMPELSAVLGIKTLEMAEDTIVRKNALVEYYRSALEAIEGIKLQAVRKQDRSTYKDFNILIDAKKFGLDRDALESALNKENIATKKYYYPPIHWQTVYKQYYKRYNGKLPVTEYVTKNCLTIPLFSRMSEEDVDKVCQAIRSVCEYKNEIVDPRLPPPSAGQASGE